MDRKHAQRRLQPQRDVDPTAEIASRINVQVTQVRIDIVMDAPPHDDADTLHHMIMAHMD